MKKRIIAGIAMCIFLLVNAGCSPEVINRKFIRKKKKAANTRIYNIKPYQQPPHKDMYANAFTFWKTWESELLMNLEQKGYAAMRNELKIMECSEQALINLRQMRKILNEDKGAELDKYIEQRKKIDEKIKQMNLTSAQAARIKNDIEKYKRIVQVNFCLTAVKGHLLPDPPKKEKIDTAEESPVFLGKTPGKKKKRRARPTKGYYPKPF